MAEGFAAIPNWIVRSTKISPHAKLVYMNLASHADEFGSTYPKQQTIADETGIGLTSVKAALTELNNLGLVTWTSGRGKGASVYRIHLRSRRGRTSAK